MNDLALFADRVAAQFNDKTETARRLKAAQSLATAYEIERPEFILVMTHPEFRRLPMQERLKKLGVTEEEFMAVFPSPSFQKFVNDYNNVMLTFTKQQAVESTSLALQSDRSDADGCADHSLEKAMLAMIAAERSKPAVAVQINNVWGAAQEAARVEQK